MEIYKNANRAKGQDLEQAQQEYFLFTYVVFRVCGLFFFACFIFCFNSCLNGGVLLKAQAMTE
jgi:hypothetical protein